MDKFELTEDKVSYIAEQLGVERSLIDNFLPVFNKFYEGVSLQHLAPVIRAMELYVRKKTKKQNFRIVWKEMPEDEEPEEARSMVGMRWPVKYGIVIPKELEPSDASPEVKLRQLRVKIGHELGHLFYAVSSPENRGNKKLNQKMANIFGVLTMMERNKFYEEKAPNVCHKGWKDIVTDFKEFRNEEAS